MTAFPLSLIYLRRKRVYLITYPFFAVRRLFISGIRHSTPKAAQFYKKRKTVKVEIEISQLINSHKNVEVDKVLL